MAGQPSKSIYVNKNGSINKNKSKNNNTPAVVNPLTGNPVNNSVKTNTSYNGNFLTVDTGGDYKSTIDSAKANGDYVTAAKAEAERNAKLIYLDRGNEVTNEFVQTYGNSPTNNQSGMTFENKFKTVSDLPSNWSTAMLNGATYKREGNNISQLVGANEGGNTYSLVGNGVNNKTGEFYFNNAEDAKNEAYRQYIGSGGNNSVAKEYALDKFVDGGFINALLKGETSAYTKNVQDIAKQKQEEELKRAAMSTKYADVDNSFESDFDKDVTADIPIVKEEVASEVVDPYTEFMKRLTNKNRMHVY